MYKNYSGFSAKSKVTKIKKVLCLTRYAKSGDFALNHKNHLLNA